MRKSNDGNTRMASMLRAMNRYVAGDADARHDDPTPYTDSAEQRAETAVGLVMALAPYLRAGMPLSTALAAEAARVGATMRAADGRVCCCVCGTPHDDAEWASWYPDEMCRPDDDDLMCASCAFGE